MNERWSGRTAVCIASGPSLTSGDCELVRRASMPTIVTNTAFRWCPWADALFAFDLKWWRLYHEEVTAQFGGRRLSASAVAANYGAELVCGPAHYRLYRNSGACAVAWAMDQGASSVVLLGYDAMLGDDGKTHCHGDHPKELENASSIADWDRQFARLARDATTRGVSVVNASRRTALTCFEREPLESALDHCEALA